MSADRSRSRAGTRTVSLGSPGRPHLARWTWLALLGLQPVWLAILPPPAGPGNWVLAALAALPLLLPLGGVWRGSLRVMTWAGYLAMLYLVIGVTEAWANPPQRPAALLQVVLVAAFVGSAVGYSRRYEPPRGRTK